MKDIIDESNKLGRPMTGFPSIDKPWLKYYSEEAINAPLPECTIYEYLWENNKDHLDDIALIYFGRKITYKRLFKNIDRAANAFSLYGIKEGSSVVVCMAAVPEAIYAILALNKIGANANMLNPTFTEHQLIDRINETNAEILLVLNELYSRIKSIIPKTKIKTVVTCAAINSLGIAVKVLKNISNIKHTITWDTFTSYAKNTKCKQIEYKPNTPAITVYSSGSTGASKGIQLTNDSINATINEYGSNVYGFKRQDRYFAQVPIWFSTGIVVTMLVPLRYGVTVILEPIYDFEIFYKHILKYKPNFLVTATGLLEYLIKKSSKLKSAKEFKYLCVGGEYISSCAERKYNLWLKSNGAKCNLQKGYGMCECGGTVTNTINQCNVIGSAGIPTPHVVVAAFDLITSKELTYGERGELYVLTPCRMESYFNKPDDTAKRFYIDGNHNVWVKTGDMGYVEEDGNVYVDGRISDSYQNNEETVYLFDIERYILDIPQVRQCKAVVQKIGGENTHVCHIVVDDDTSKEEILMKIRERCSTLPVSHYPRLFKFYETALPIASSGKLDVVQMENDFDNIISVEGENVAKTNNHLRKT